MLLSVTSQMSLAFLHHLEWRATLTKGVCRSGAQERLKCLPIGQYKRFFSALNSTRALEMYSRLGISWVVSHPLFFLKQVSDSLSAFPSGYPYSLLHQLAFPTAGPASVGAGKGD